MVARNAHFRPRRPARRAVDRIGKRMGQNAIVIKGAREHNLKDVDLTIPRDELVVITGL